MDHSKKKRASGKSSDESSSSSAGNTEFSYKNFRPRKKSAQRRADAGRRYQRGRVYDSALGITCHFCRQKTTEKHVVCCGRTCVLAYCGSCLHNRHGEDIDIETADEDYTWLCPKCRGGCGPGCKNCCNCTFCRKKQNLRPPKIPNSEMQARGFDNVHDYLIHLETGESPMSISARKLGKGWCRTNEQSVPKSNKKSKDHEQRETDTGKGSYEAASSVIHEQSEKNTGKGIDEMANSVTQGCCHTHENTVPKSHQSSKVHEQRETHTRGVDTHEGSYEVASSGIHKQHGKDTCKGLDEVASSGTQATPPQVTHKKSFPSQFCSRNSFKEKLETKLAESFNSQELTELWDAIKCRKPLCKMSETPQGTHGFPTKEPGYSYIDHHPDLGRKLTATGDKEEKLKLLRGFFFWLEHASMSGSFKPWLENDKDVECLELDGPDCQVLGVLINLDEHRHGEKQEDTNPKIKQDVKESLSPQAKIIFNWDEEDVKPRIKEESVKFSSFNTQIHVKEEQDTS